MSRRGDDYIGTMAVQEKHRFDEPSLGLAPPIVAQMMAMLRDLRASSGLTVLLVEQNVRSALDIADRGVVVSLGSVVAQGRADELQADVKLRHAYLGF